MNVLGIFPRRRSAARNVALADLFGINRRNVELVYHYNERRHYPLADDKILCKSVLAAHGVPVAKTLATIGAPYEIDDAIQSLSARGSFVVKPANGSGGGGIVVIGERCAEGFRGVDGTIITFDELRHHLASIVFGAYSNQMEDRALVEERIVPHRLPDEFWSQGVSDIRILTLRARPLLGMLRIPTARSKGRAMTCARSSSCLSSRRHLTRA